MRGRDPKYVCIDLPLEGVTYFMFPDVITHAEFAARFAPAPVLSAGFVTILRDHATCYGESVSLRIVSRPEDSRELSKQFNLEVP